MPDGGAVPVPEMTRLEASTEPDASVVTVGYPLAVKVVHPAGTPGDPVMVSAVLGLKPFAEKNATTLGVVAGAYATPELTAPTPSVMVTVGVIVNDAMATSPRLSVTVIVWAPAAKLASREAAVTVNMNATVPCSVTFAIAGTVGESVSRGAAFPILTLAILAPGPNPATVAVTCVPTGPEAGDRVTVGTLRVYVVVATLPKLSVKVNDVPVVIAGRLTVPV